MSLDVGDIAVKMASLEACVMRKWIIVWQGRSTVNDEYNGNNKKPVS